MLLVCAENDEIMRAFCQPAEGEIRLCRQRLPLLPPGRSSRPLACALLDCLTLWLRHNLQKRLEVTAYDTCLRTAHRILSFLQTERIRLEHHWEELWQGILGLMEFLPSRVDTIKSIRGSYELVQLAVIVLAFAISSDFFPAPKGLHQLVYEIVRSSATILKQRELLAALRVPLPESRRDVEGQAQRVDVTLQAIEKMIKYYGDKLAESKARSAADYLRVISREIDKDGVRGFESVQPEEPSKKRGDSKADVNFTRWACEDGMALMAVG